MSLRAEILDFFKRDPRPADFCFLEDLLYWSGGDMSLVLNENTVLWFGMSQETTNTLVVMYEAGEIHFRPVSTLTYLVGASRLPTLPIAKTGRKYKKPHWLPVVVAPGRLKRK